jgi:hypothetical protein
MICFECIEKKDCIPSALQLFDEHCSECGKKYTTVANPIEKPKYNRNVK